MPERTPLIAGNWKMNETATEARELVGELLPLIAHVEGVEVVLAPPFTALAAVREAIDGTEVGLAAQDMHEEPSGAFTGEISAPMLLDAGAATVILGHSERRRLFGETDGRLALKVPAASAAGLRPILCVGETEVEREAGETEAVLRRQLEADLEALPDESFEGLVIAYEPIWAIGTGKTATPDLAQDAVAFVRAVLAALAGDAAERIRILYGGSVNGENSADLLTQTDIDGALVGGASLDAEAFAAIVASAAEGSKP